MIERVLRHIAAFRNRPSQRLLDTIYGPAARPLRTQIMALILDRKVTLLKLAGVENIHSRCIATEDAEFEHKAEAILAEAAAADDGPYGRIE